MPAPQSSAKTEIASRRALDAARLSVGVSDLAVAMITFILSSAVLLIALRGAPLGLVVTAHVGVVIIPLSMLVQRLRAGEELVMPVLLLVGVAMSGPLGSGGCAAMALMLCKWPSRPERLHDWYDYIAGVDELTLLEKTYRELTSARLPADLSTPIERFEPLLNGSSLAMQQRILGLIGRHYHSDFHASLKKALRSKNILIKAQAAAIASALTSQDKARLWQRVALPAEPRPELARIEHHERTET